MMSKWVFGNNWIKGINFDSVCLPRFDSFLFREKSKYEHLGISSLKGSSWIAFREDTRKVLIRDLTPHYHGVE